MLTAFGMIFLVFALFLGRETVWIPCRNAVSAWWWDAVPAKVISYKEPGRFIKDRYVIGE